MNYIISKYVYQFVSSRNENLAYCARSNSFLKITPQLFEFIEECRKNNNRIQELNDEVFSLLKKQKIIVTENEDSDFLLEHQMITDQKTYSRSILGLTLVPTLSCNFDCPYCFENSKRPKTMSDKIIDDLISFIGLHMESQFIDITWYGGEPLLAFNVIKKILRQITKKIRMPIRNHSIITNGYYFNSQVIEFFKEFPLNSIQITLDGNKERHDKIRKHKKKGEGSFDRLIKNMDEILKKLPDTKLSVRINIEKSNIGDFYILQKELYQKWNGKNVSIYPGILRIDNETGTDLSCGSLHREEIDELIYSLRKDKVLNDPIYPSLSLVKNCCATMLNSFVIGPEGEFYKCWNDVSDNNKVIGYINKKKIDNPTLLHRYIVGAKWYNNKDCRDCFALPICKGTCAWYRLRNIYEKGDFNTCNCLQRNKKMLNRCLEGFYYDDNEIINENSIIS